MRSRTLSRSFRSSILAIAGALWLLPTLDAVAAESSAGRLDMAVANVDSEIVVSAPAGDERIGRPARYAGHKVVRTRLETTRQLRTMLALSDDPWSESVGLGVVDFRVSPEAFESLTRTDIDFAVLIDDVQAMIDAERARIAAAPEGGLAGGDWFSEYKTWEEVDEFMETLALLRPDLAELFDVGLTIEGRMVRGLRIGHDPNRSKPAMLLHGCQHAREWISVMVTAYVADALVRNESADPQIDSLLDAMEFFVIPVVNPDGYVYSWGPDRLWRKNRRDNGDGTFGVDPNRNWSVGWGGPGSSGNPNSQVYRGTAPFSEPEVANLRDLMLAHPQITAYLDIHSFSQLILAPWGFTNALPADHDTFEFLGQAQADLIASVDGKIYIHGPAGPTLYLASGIASDWAYGELGIWGFTYELRDTGQFGFLLPADQIIPNSEEVLPAILFLAEWASQPVQIDLPDGVPQLLEADEPNSITIRVVPIADSVGGGSVVLHSRVAGDGPFVASPATEIEPTLYEATFPPTACGVSIEFFVEVVTESGAVVLHPDDAPVVLYGVPVQSSTLFFSDDFSDDFGWISGAPDDDATTGHWVRANPVGTFVNGVPVQPSEPFVGDLCWITGQHPGGGAGANDVDNGKTTLLSPIFDLSEIDSGQFALVSYWRWYSNAAGANPFNDIFRVDVSDDGGETWANIETVGPTPPEVNGGWFFREWSIGDFAALTDSVQFRFVASDEDPQALVEAALDLVEIRVVGCPTAPSIPGDLNGDGVVDGADLGILLSAWGACDDCEECPADLTGDCTVDGSDLGVLLENWS